MNPLKRLIRPRLPHTAVGLESGSATVVSLDRRRSSFTLHRAAHVKLPPALVRPSFDEPNISDTKELGHALAELAASAGLARRRRWSVALPEAAARASIILLETEPASRNELAEMIDWKIERSLGVPSAELRASRMRLAPDERGRSRYLVTGIRLSVLEEYEATFSALGWHTGLILPRHLGEARWLMNGPGDALLVSSHAAGFTAVFLRDGQPLMTRGVVCDEEDRPDELHRLVLYYHDRMLTVNPESNRTIERLLVLGEGFDAGAVSSIVSDTLETEPRTITAQDVGLSLPSPDLSFQIIAAPAGLAALAWD